MARIMQTIGFATEFYTLWEVSDPYKVPVNAYQYYMKQDFNYVQNLSKTLEGAKAKIKGEFTIDLTLRGHSSFVRSSDILSGFEVWQFTFGKLMGMDIRTCEDVWQLERAMDEEKREARSSIAKQRLIELGEIIRFDGDWIKKSQIAGRMEQKRKQALKNGHFFTDGQKVKLTVELEEEFNFKTQFGTCYICVFRDAEGRLFKYKGGSPPELAKIDSEGIREYKDGSTYNMTATVKHGQYKEVDETYIQRIKITGIIFPTEVTN